MPSLVGQTWGSRGLPIACLGEILMKLITRGTTSLALTLCFGWGTATAAGPKSVDSQPWYSRILGQKPTEEKPAAKAATTMRPPLIIAPLAPEVLSESVKAEESACTRRLDACAKLREAAMAKNDDALLSQIDELERQAIELCQARIARMGVRGNTLRAAVVRASEKPLSTELTTVSPPKPLDAGGSR
jgi:hypothetical protein